MLQEIINQLVKADRAIFTLINQQWSTGWLDGFMLLLRNQNTWIPLYLLVLFLVYKGSPKMVGPFILASVLTFFITDYTSSSIIKPWVGRLRPCFDPLLTSTIHSLTDCGGKFSFPSSHAANHFGLATIWYQVIKLLQGKKWHWVWPWAAAVCYAQVYVGKHFPFDTVAGAVLGVIAGLLVSKIFRHWFQKLQQRNSQHIIHTASSNNPISE